jgi:acyl-CoA hydrolase
MTNPLPQPRHVSDSAFTLSQFMLPEHSNSQGRVHGGVVMKLCDECGGIVAARHSRRPVVTVTVDSVTFHRPIELGSLLLLHGRLNYVGTSSLEVEVRVEAENLLTGEVVHTNSAFFVYVALDDNRRPTTVPPLELQSDEERRRFEQGRARQSARLARAREQE